MKKLFIFAAAAATVLLASCNKEEAKKSSDAIQQEISVTSVALTKGYVEADKFVDTPYDALHPSDNQTDRTLVMSSFLTPQSGASTNYFVGELFAKGTETDHPLWHHTPAIYWPMGGTLDFLAYSSTIPFSGTAVKWSEENAANECVLYVSEEYLQDDVLYGGVKGRQTLGGAPVAMQFKHTQAWIQFQIKVQDASMNNIIKINDITIKNLQTRGELTIKGGESPEAKWNFNSETAFDRAMDDTYGILAPAYISDEVGYMDMLVPEQPQTEFVIHYTMAGQDAVLEYSCNLATAQWQKGKKYIYEITFKPYEITVDPSVVPFDVVDPGAAGFPLPLE